MGFGVKFVLWLLVASRVQCHPESCQRFAVVNADSPKSTAKSLLHGIKSEELDWAFTEALPLQSHASRCPSVALTAIESISMVITATGLMA